MDYDRKFTEKRGSEDCFGRCLFALGYVASRPHLPDNIRGCAEKLLRRTVSSCSSLTFPKGKAYACVGLSLWKDGDAVPYLEMLRESLADTYHPVSEGRLALVRRENHLLQRHTATCHSLLPTTTKMQKAKLELKVLIFCRKLHFATECLSPSAAKAG